MIASSQIGARRGGRKRMVFGIILLAVLALIAVFYLVVRPWSHRRGATDAEVTRALPGDDLVPAPKTGYTQAITIDAPPAQVWPWVVQIGYQRAGWYTYEFAYRLLKANDFYDGDRSAERIIPELQDLQVGDSVKIFEQAPFTVMQVEPRRVLVLLARVNTESGQFFELSDSLPAHYLNQSWVFYMEEAGPGQTRLIARWRGDYSPDFGNMLGIAIPTEAGALLMQPKMLKGIKERAER
jgi:hypothetical protein